jgi:predicted nuclease with TOPRIM domain
MQQMIFIFLAGILLVEILLWFVIVKMVSRVEETNRMVVKNLLEQNQSLTGCLQEVQAELLNLNHELNLLAIENKNLNREVEALSSEVSRLQQQLSNNSNHDELPGISRSVQ